MLNTEETVKSREDRAPKVSIGIPVYNGENFIRHAIESFLKQTYTDFELVICDNASTDKTGEICREYAEKDSRIRYFRNEVNIGASPNFNRVFQLSRGEYFKWAAHDDVCAPEYLEKCVAVLENDPEVVLCYPKTKIIDPAGNVISTYDLEIETDAAEPQRRFRELILTRNHKCFEAFALIRSSVLKDTKLMGSFPVADRILLGEIAFRGKFHLVPEYLFFNRDHPQQSVRSRITQHERVAWFDPLQEGRILFPEWRTFLEYWRSIKRSPIGFYQRVRCYIHMLKWLRHFRKRMRRDIVIVARRLLKGSKLAANKN